MPPSADVSMVCRTRPSAYGVSVVRSVLSVTRNWTDKNGDYLVDCDLNNPLAQTGTDDCGLRGLD